MLVHRLSFDKYRNLKTGEIESASGINVIYGDNAQGKTNLLEAIWMFSGAQSFRGAKDIQCIRDGEDSAKLNLEFSASGRDQTAEIIFDGRRNATLNGVKLKSGSELAGEFKAVVFSPVHLSLIKDGPSERRRFMDTAIGQLWPKYINLLRRYARAMQQRNSLLKDVRFHAQLFDMLEVYDGELSEIGAKITEYRLRFTERLKKYAAEVYSGISGGKETLGIEYICTGGYTAEQMREALKAARGDDLESGHTSVGPHRDDLNLLINNKSARAFGSQGQQRSAVIALKMSEAEVIYAVTNEHPVILLDDVMSELDENRQDYILNHISGRQVFITCCDKQSISLLNGGALFKMQGGVITKEE